LKAVALRATRRFFGCALRASLRMTSKAEGKDNGEIRGFFAALRMTSSWVGVDKLPRYAG